MYRAATLAALRAGLNLDNQAATTALVRESDIRLEKTEEGLRTFLNGEDVSEEIRSPEVSRGTSPISETAGIRTRLVDLQRAMGRRGGVVMEGRDIGTVVFPDADFKFFLVADPDERARRRFMEQQSKGIAQSMEEVKADLLERDRRDSTRAVAPLRRAEDAMEVDTTNLTLDQVIDHIAEIILKDSAESP
jgi:cytidylate kinase